MKYLFLSIYSLFIFFTGNNHTEEVKVVQKFPASITADATVDVELTINKGEVKGFAKLEQQLPDGFTALPLDLKGGSFTFEKQKIKVIWMSLPSTKEFKITYSIKANAEAKGQKSIGGKVYYVINNQKQINEITPSIVEVK